MLNCQSSIDTEITMFSFSNSCLVILLLGVLILTPPVDGWGVSTVICTGTYKHHMTGITFFHIWTYIPFCSTCLMIRFDRCVLDYSLLMSCSSRGYYCRWDKYWRTNDSNGLRSNSSNIFLIYV